MGESNETTSGSAIASRELSVSVLENLLEGCQVIGPDYRYLYVNGAVVRHGRRSRESMLGRTMMECYPGIQDTQMFALVRRCMEERSPAHLENEFTFPDGTTGWFELRFEPVPEGITILSVDITERKRAEQALHRKIRALKTLSRSNQTLVRASDEHNLIQDVCRLVVESGGYPTAWVGLVDEADDAEIRAIGCAGFEGGVEGLSGVLRSSSPDYKELLQRAMSTGATQIARAGQTGIGSDEDTNDASRASFICLPLGSNGTRLGTLTIHASEPDAFDDDERHLLTEVAMDLGYGIANIRARTAQAQTLAALDESRARTRAIADHLPHAILVWRRDGDGFALVDFNEAAAAQTDGRVSALLGSSAAECGFGVPQLEEHLARCMDDPAGLHHEAECTLPGATRRRRMILTYGAIPPDMVLLHAQDVTEQRRVEQQLVAAQRLEAIGRLAGGVAHDFNNLLTAVLSFGQFAVDQLDPSHPAREDVEEIIAAGRRAERLTSQLLAFSRKQILEPQATSLNTVIGEVENMLRQLLGEDVDLQMRTAENLGNILADPGRLEQVIMNLALNAREAMPQGGTLIIETANVDLDETHAAQNISATPGRFARLSVTDTGVGMTAEERDRVFEPFFTTKGEDKGTGLGLSTVYGIVKQSGGIIWVRSEPGQGTTFEVLFPLVAAATTEPGHVRSDNVTTGNESILVVEDNDAIRNVVERILRGAGYQVLAAANGADALQLCAQTDTAIDLLLTDVVMPAMSGPELADRLRETYPGRRLEVLFTSGYTDAAISSHGAHDMRTRFIAKPFSGDELTRKVREVLDGGE